MKINREKLYELYMQKVNEIAEKCEHVTHFTPKQCVEMVVNVLENNPSLIEIPENEDKWLDKD